MQARFAYFAENNDHYIRGTAKGTYTRACACRRGEVGGAGKAVCNDLRVDNVRYRGVSAQGQCNSRPGLKPIKRKKRTLPSRCCNNISGDNRRWIFAFIRGKHETLHNHRVHGSLFKSEANDITCSGVKL